jgi:hypothetical protein
LYRCSGNPRQSRRAYATRLNPGCFILEQGMGTVPIHCIVLSGGRATDLPYPAPTDQKHADRRDKYHKPYRAGIWRVRNNAKGGKMNILIWPLAAVISAILYRAGGMSKDKTAKPTWIPVFMRKSWVRDWLCPAVLLGLVGTCWGLEWAFWWVYAIFYGLSGAALSCYWSFFKYHDPPVEEDNFFLHGLGCGLAGIPLIWAGVPWYIILLRTVICAIGMYLWSKWISVDWQEEMGRGALFIL